METHTAESFIVPLVSSAASGLITFMTTKDTVLTAVSVFIPLALAFAIPKTMPEPIEFGLLVLSGIAAAYAFKFIRDNIYEEKQRKTAKVQNESMKGAVTGSQTLSQLHLESIIEKQYEKINEKLDNIISKINELEDEVKKANNVFAGYLLQLENKIDDSFKKINGDVWTILKMIEQTKK